MEGLSERDYATHSWLSRGAVQKARKTGRLVLFADGSIDAAASDARRGAMTDPDQQARSRGSLPEGQYPIRVRHVRYYEDRWFGPIERARRGFGSANPSPKTKIENRELARMTHFDGTTSTIRQFAEATVAFSELSASAESQPPNVHAK